MKLLTGIQYLGSVTALPDHLDVFLHVQNTLESFAKQLVIVSQENFNCLFSGASLIIHPGSPFFSLCSLGYGS
ncbi:hypothetical protein D3C76_1550280 [compost metagenome]